MAKKKVDVEEVVIEENIVRQNLENVMGDRYATYAKYVIQDRAIPDVRDGMKPVQRRIIFSMYKHGNTFNKPTRKCAHTVGAVMGTYHPHGDTSIYDALARMSQDWKLRYPLIDFQGNNGSIDGDSPAAYRYTESRLALLSNELIRDIDKETVDMQLNFDDTEFEPTVLPARFPNLLVNGSEGIAVALATEIPPHNLREVIDATIYRISHKNCEISDLRQFVQGPDFPTGGIIYNSDGLDAIYETGRGKIEMSAKAEIVKSGNIQQIIIKEIPYKVVKISLVHEIDKIRAGKSIDGIIEVRDESDWKGIRIVIDLKKDAKADLILAYLMKKTQLRSNYSANMVAIVDGRPKTLNLLQFIDAYIAHQIDVVTRSSTFDLTKCKNRLHIVEGLILAAININEVVNIIKASKDKADSKINLIKRYDFSNEQAEAIVMMPLYKLSHTDEVILQNEKVSLEKEIERLTGILEDPNKLNRYIIKDLKAVSEKYGDDRRTTITEKVETKPIDKRDLIAKEECILAITRDGYAKRSTVKSYRSSGENVMPGLKEGDTLIGYGPAYTTDYIVCFTNYGNYAALPVHIIPENRWKDEGIHLNTFFTFASGEKMIKSIVVTDFREDVYLGFLTKYGQIKRMSLSNLDSLKHNRPQRCMRIAHGDEVSSVAILTGNSDLLVITSGGNCSYFNENELNPLGPKASGVKSISQLGKQTAESLLAFDEEERSKIVMVTDKGCIRIFHNEKVFRTNRLGKVQTAFQSFKNDVHKLVYAFKIAPREEMINLTLTLDDNSIVQISHDDLYMTEVLNAKKNIKDIPSSRRISHVLEGSMEVINKNTITHPIVLKEPKIREVEKLVEEIKIDDNSDTNYEQISIFDDLDEE